MGTHEAPSSKNWSGRKSDKQLYLHEKVQCCSPDQLPEQHNQSMAILGYACDEGVRRNQGRVGTKEGPEHIRRALAKMPNHLPGNIAFFDIGNITCSQGKMEQAQHALATYVTRLLSNNIFPIVLGGGHDVAYGHYNGIKSFLEKTKNRLGIINFDAHFDLRNSENTGNSGTPFYQIAKDCAEASEKFNYLCLGVRKDANDRSLFETAEELGVIFVDRKTFSMQYVEEINQLILAFLQGVDHIYITIDLDGFSSAFAPGVSAASPMGYSQDIVLACLRTILASEKLISLDVAEMNPTYDVDGQTAKLAASLVHYVIHNLPLSHPFRAGKVATG